MIYERQIKGIITICIALAVIPFFIFISGSKVNNIVPELSGRFSEKIVVEIIENNNSRGIYFVDGQTSANELLKSIGIKGKANVDFPLNKGMKISIGSTSDNNIVKVSGLESAKLLALGMKIDINSATENDLVLVPGIGEVTAKQILDLRIKQGRYKNIDQLTGIKGIKEKRLTKLRQYLYVK